MTKIFLKTLSSFYYERMIASAPSDFTKMVNMGMRLEEGVREGRLTRDEGSPAKHYGAFEKKKEGEAHDVSSHIKQRPSVKRKTVRPASNQHQMAHIAPAFREAQHYQHQQQHQQYPQQHHRSQQQTYQPRNNNNTRTIYDRKRVTFDPIPLTYAELYPSLIDKKLITPRDPPVVPANPQWWYKPELHCVYHYGAPGHDVENCYPLKTKGCLGKYKVLYVSHIRQSLVDMHRLLYGYNHYEHDHDRCRVCTVNERESRQVRKDIQEMLDQGVIEILQNRDEDEVNVISPVFRIPKPVVVRYDGSKKKVSSSLIIKPAGPVPYSSDKVVPYRYNAVALEDGKELPLPSTSVVSISDVSGVTCSCRVFSVPLKSQDDMRRATVDNSSSPVGDSSSPNPVIAVKGVNPAVVVKALVPVGPHGILKEDYDEMLRIIKRSEYNRVLDVAYVDHDVTIEQFDSIVANITACAVISTLHQKLKFVKNKKLVVIGGEKALLVSHLSSFSYIDAEDEFGTPFQALSIDEPSRKGPSSFSSYNGAKLAIEHGTTTGLGQMIRLEDNKSRAGIGYSSGISNEHGLFQSGGFIHTVEDQEAAAIVEDDAEEYLGNFVILGGVCNNWVATDVSTVVRNSTLIKPIEPNLPTPSPNFEFPVFEAEEDDVEEIPDDITRLLEHGEKIIQPHLENLETVNLGSEDCVCEVKIRALLEESVKKGLIELLREYFDVFAWSYEDMLGLDTDIVQHFLPLKP
ncbi:hypothetical protein KIW84_064315 [Lathyrus oleraceus]|uniref:Uncharacterized protein n=1 Tax=Pisum sativum TaxID=3888 RepID=A0A9D4WBB7_PEA|nr:hypothetical protein KIW84_064315 [Pisum sativum]